MPEKLRIVGWPSWPTAEDSYRLAEIFQSVFRRNDSIFVIMELIAAEQRAGHRYLIASDGPRILGFVSWFLRGEPRHRIAELNHIGVIRDSGFPRLGQDLVAAMEADARSCFREHGLPGNRKVYLLTHKHNRPAQLLYRRCGYRHVATLPGFFHDDVDEYVFEKRFADEAAPPLTLEAVAELIAPTDD